MKKMNDRSVCRTGAAAPLILIAIVAVAMIGGGLYYYLMGGAQEIKINPIIASAKKGEFISQVVDSASVGSTTTYSVKKIFSTNQRMTPNNELTPPPTKSETDLASHH